MSPVLLHLADPGIGGPATTAALRRIRGPLREAGVQPSNVGRALNDVDLSRRHRRVLLLSPPPLPNEYRPDLDGCTEVRALEVLRAVGPVEVVVLLSRPEEMVAWWYHDRVLKGRWRPLTPAHAVAGTRDLNTIPAVLRWLAATSAQGGARITVRLVANEDGVAGSTRALLSSLAIGDLGPPRREPSSPGTDEDHPMLSATGVEALRRVNEALAKHPGPRLDAQREQSVAIIRSRVLGQPGFRLPLERARALRDQWSRRMAEVAPLFSEADAEAYLSPVAGVPHDADAAAAEAMAHDVLRELGMAERSTASGGRDLAVLVDAAETALRSDPRAAGPMLVRIGALVTSGEEVLRFGPTSARQIPRALVQYWDPLPPPSDVAGYVRTWAELGMSGGHRLCSVAEADDVLTRAAGPRGAAAFAGCGHPAARSDLFRYAWLLLHGGWYVDADHSARVPLPEALPVDRELVLVRRTRAPRYRSEAEPVPNLLRVVNGFMGAVPGNDVIAEVLDEACRRVLEQEGGSVLARTGPPVLRAVLARRLSSGSPPSCLVLPANVVFGRLQRVHQEAEYKGTGHWRDHRFATADPRPEGSS